MSLQRHCSCDTNAYKDAASDLYASTRAADGGSHTNCNAYSSATANYAAYSHSHNSTNRNLSADTDARTECNTLADA
jgi:hypothetical protein